MKHIILFYFLIISFASLVGQGYNKSIYYLGDSSSVGQGIQSFKSIEGKLYLVINYVDSNQNQSLAMIVTDLNGNLLNKRLLADTNYWAIAYEGNSLIVDKDSNLVICAGIVSNTTSNIDGLLIKLSRNLDTIWTRKYDLPYNLAGCSAGQNPLNYFTAIRLCADGNYILSANYDKNCVTNNYGCYLQKIDTAGNVIWTQPYTNIQSCFDFEIAPDSGFYIAAPKNDVFYVTKTDLNGNQQWNKRVNSNQQHREPEDIENFDSTHIVVASGYYLDFASMKAALNVCKLNTSSKTIDWEKNYMIYSNLVTPVVNQYLKMIVLPNKDILIAASALVINYNSTKDGIKGILLKLNSNGDSLWSRYYSINDFSDYSSFCDMMLMDDGGFLAVGYNDNHVEHLACSAWLVRMDSLGYAPGCGTVGVESLKVESGKLKVYPNPASTVITIEAFENENLPDEVLQIFDVFGTLVTEVEIPKNQLSFELNISELSNGMYMGIFVGNGKNNWSFRFVKE